MSAALRTAQRAGSVQPPSPMGPIVPSGNASSLLHWPASPQLGPGTPASTSTRAWDPITKSAAEPQPAQTMIAAARPFRCRIDSQDTVRRTDVPSIDPARITAAVMLVGAADSIYVESDLVDPGDEPGRRALVIV